MTIEELRAETERIEVKLDAGFIGQVIARKMDWSRHELGFNVVAYRLIKGPEVTLENV